LLVRSEASATVVIEDDGQGFDTEAVMGTLRQELLEEVHLQIIGRNDQNILKRHRRFLTITNDLVCLKLGDESDHGFRLGAAARTEWKAAFLIGVRREE
jgi:hypothetical protein